MFPTTVAARVQCACPLGGGTHPLGVVMRVSALLASSMLLLMASSGSAVTMAWTPIGNPGNACDPQPQGCFGAVGYSYSIGTYEVTNAQYAEFLNAKAASDPYGLYSEYMDSVAGGITRSGSSGSYAYAAIPF